MRPKKKSITAHVLIYVFLSTTLVSCASKFRNNIAENEKNHSKIDALEKRLALAEKRNNELKKQIHELSPPEGALEKPEINEKETLANFNFVTPKNDHEYAQQLFQISQLIDSGRYEEAILGLSHLYKQNSSDSLRARTIYLLGEALHFQGDFKLAGTRFEELLLNYPESGKSSDALLGLYKIAERKGARLDMVKYREYLLNFFPDSPAALKVSQTSFEEQNSAPSQGIYDTPMGEKRNN
jgi:TolA-binding protein